MVLAHAYVSFPMSSVIKEDETKLVIKWQGYKIVDSGVVSSKTEEYKIERPYKKGTFEHVPAEKTSAMLFSAE